jgi:hypothetical protein
MLTWKPLGDGYMATSNSRIVGIVTPRDDGAVTWEITAVYMKWIGKGRGKCRTVPTAKAALRRAWQRWMAAFGVAYR